MSMVEVSLWSISSKSASNFHFDAIVGVIFHFVINFIEGVEGGSLEADFDFCLPLIELPVPKGALRLTLKTVEV